MILLRIRGRTYVLAESGLLYRGIASLGPLDYVNTDHSPRRNGQWNHLVVCDWRYLAADRPAPYHRLVGGDRRLGGDVDAINQWFNEQSQTPVGSLLLFLLVFLARVGIDEASRRRAKHREHRKRAEA